jgi:hypothetical protein
MFPSHLALQEGSTIGLDQVKHKHLIFDMVSVSASPLKTPDDWVRNCKVSMMQTDLDPYGAMFVT